MKPIFTALEPNTTWKDAFLFFFYIFNIKRWREKDGIINLENFFKKFFKIQNAITFDSARSGLFLTLEYFNVEKGDEVIMQSFNCVAVVNPILWAGATPVFTDISKDNLTIDIENLKQKITEKTKVIIIQHTFGCPANVEEILKIAKKYRIKVIEDCAHTIGGKSGGKLLGTFGDAAIFSFGRDKVISGGAGGILITNDNKLGKYLKEKRKELPTMPTGIVIKHLLHPLILNMTRTFYNIFFLGKIIHFFALKIGAITKATSEEEKRCSGRPYFMPGKMPNVLALLALKKLKTLNLINQYRLELKEIYEAKIKNKNTKSLNCEDKSIFFLRYPLLLKNKQERQKFLDYMEENSIYLDTWYDTPIAPKEVNLEATGYKLGSCKKTEYVCDRIVNLPISKIIKKKDVLRIINILNKFK